MTKPIRTIDITGFPLWRRMLATAWECLAHPLTPTTLVSSRVRVMLDNPKTRYRIVDVVIRREEEESS